MSWLSKEWPLSRKRQSNLPLAEVIMKPHSNPSLTAFVGIDWADKKHDFCMPAAGSDQRVFGSID